MPRTTSLAELSSAEGRALLRPLIAERYVLPLCEQQRAEREVRSGEVKETGRSRGKRATSTPG